MGGGERDYAGSVGFCEELEDGEFELERKAEEAGELACWFARGCRSLERRLPAVAEVFAGHYDERFGASLGLMRDSFKP